MFYRLLVFFSVVLYATLGFASEANLTAATSNMVSLKAGHTASELALSLTGKAANYRNMSFTAMEGRHKGKVYSEANGNFNKMLPGQYSYRINSAAATAAMNARSPNAITKPHFKSAVTAVPTGFGLVKTDYVLKSAANGKPQAVMSGVPAHQEENAMLTLKELREMFKEARQLLQDPSVRQITALTFLTAFLFFFLVPMMAFPKFFFPNYFKDKKPKPTPEEIKLTTFRERFYLWSNLYPEDNGSKEVLLYRNVNLEQYDRLIQVANRLKLDYRVMNDDEGSAVMVLARNRAVLLASLHSLAAAAR